MLIVVLVFVIFALALVLAVLVAHPDGPSDPLGHCAGTTQPVNAPLPARPPGPDECSADR